MASRSSEVWWKSKTKHLPRSFAELIRIYSEKMATSLKSNAIVAYPVLVVRLDSTERRRRHLVDHRYTLLGSLPGIAELRVEDGYFEVDESVSA